MFKNEANILCLLCSKDKENIENFILDCERLEEVRKPILQEIGEILNDKEVDLQYWVPFPFFQINTAQIPKAIIIWSRLYNWLAPMFMYF
jgi:hypothetical protein